MHIIMKELVYTKALALALLC